MLVKFFVMPICIWGTSAILQVISGRIVSDPYRDEPVQFARAELSPLLKLACRIADLVWSESVQPAHLVAAVQYHPKLLLRQ